MSIEITGALELAADMGRAAVGAIEAVTQITEATGVELRETWKDNARQTAGKHGRRYPASITSERIPAFGAAVVEIGPDSSKPQGGMGPGFEYGSVNQPPHLDGTKAVEEIEPKYASEIELAIGGLL